MGSKQKWRGTRRKESRTKVVRDKGIRHDCKIKKKKIDFCSFIWFVYALGVLLPLVRGFDKYGFKRNIEYF